MCTVTAAFGFCCRSAAAAAAAEPAPTPTPPPPVAPLNPVKVSSKFWGVGWNNRDLRWIASFRHNGRVVNIKGTFATDKDAADAVDKFLIENGRPNETNHDANGIFRPRVSTKSSKFRGVTWDKSHNQWHAQIKVAGKLESLGYFDDENEAARAYDTRAAALGRETNFDGNGAEIDYAPRGSGFQPPAPPAIQVDSTWAAGAEAFCFSGEAWS